MALDSLLAPRFYLFQKAQFVTASSIVRLVGNRASHGENMSNMRGKKVLVIDDDFALLDLVGSILSQVEAHVYTASSGQEGLRQFYDCQPDLVILDLMMPYMSGWEVCRHIRLLSDVPLIILTALDQDDQVIRGLDSGADDYIIKPFKPAVLLARAKTALRRATHPSSISKSVTYNDGYLTIDLDKRQVMAGNEPVKLSATGYQLLAYLLQNANRVLTFSQLLDHIWGEECHENTEYIHTYIWFLRKKLEKDPKHPLYILTEHGVGYRFQKQIP
jgi:DNA-binding response OmpR family regulator